MGIQFARTAWSCRFSPLNLFVCLGFFYKNSFRSCVDAAVSVAPFWLQFFTPLQACTVRCAANQTLVICRTGQV
jgi:hypothetical protein